MIHRYIARLSIALCCIVALGLQILHAADQRPVADADPAARVANIQRALREPATQTALKAALIAARNELAPHSQEVLDRTLESLAMLALNPENPLAYLGTVTALRTAAQDPEIQTSLVSTLPHELEHLEPALTQTIQAIAAVNPMNTAALQGTKAHLEATLETALVDQRTLPNGLAFLKRKHADLPAQLQERTRPLVENLEQAIQDEDDAALKNIAQELISLADSPEDRALLIESLQHLPPQVAPLGPVAARVLESLPKFVAATRTEGGAEQMREATLDTLKNDRATRIAVAEALRAAQPPQDPKIQEALDAIPEMLENALGKEAQEKKEQALAQAHRAIYEAKNQDTRWLGDFQDKVLIPIWDEGDIDLGEFGKINAQIAFTGQDIIVLTLKSLLIAIEYQHHKKIDVRGKNSFARALHTNKAKLLPLFQKLSYQKKDGPTIENAEFDRLLAFMEEHCFPKSFSAQLVLSSAEVLCMEHLVKFFAKQCGINPEHLDLENAFRQIIEHLSGCITNNYIAPFTDEANEAVADVVNELDEEINGEALFKLDHGDDENHPREWKRPLRKEKLVREKFPYKPTITRMHGATLTDKNAVIGISVPALFAINVGLSCFAGFKANLLHSMAAIISFISGNTLLAAFVEENKTPLEEFLASKKVAIAREIGKHVFLQHRIKGYLRAHYKAFLAQHASDIHAALKGPDAHTEIKKLLDSKLTLSFRSWWQFKQQTTGLYNLTAELVIGGYRTYKIVKSGIQTARNLIPE